MTYRLLIVGFAIFMGYQALDAGWLAYLSVLSLPARVCYGC